MSDTGEQIGLSAPDGFDASRLRELRDLLPATDFREFLVMFVEDAEARLPVLRTLAAGENLDALRQESHTLLGIAAKVGARRLGDASRAVEAACRSADRDAATRLAAELGDALRGAERELRLWLASTPATAPRMTEV